MELIYIPDLRVPVCEANQGCDAPSVLAVFAWPMVIFSKAAGI